MNFRAEKDTPARNATRTLMAGIVIGLLILIGLDPAIRFYDQHILQRPWIEAGITLEPNRGRPAGPPDIVHQVRARRQLVGLANAWVNTRHGVQCRRQSQILYGSGLVAERTGWGAYFGVECRPPGGAYRVCVSYIVETPRQARDVAGPYCSEEHEAP